MTETDQANESQPNKSQTGERHFALIIASIGVLAAGTLVVFGIYWIDIFLAVEATAATAAVPVREALVMWLLSMLICASWLSSERVISLAKSRRGEGDITPCIIGALLLFAAVGLSMSALSVGGAFVQIAQAQVPDLAAYREDISKCYLPNRFGYGCILAATVLQWSSVLRAEKAPRDPKFRPPIVLPIVTLVGLILIVCASYFNWRNAEELQEAFGKTTPRPGEMAARLSDILRGALATCVGLVIVAITQFFSFFRRR